MTFPAASYLRIAVLLILLVLPWAQAGEQPKSKGPPEMEGSQFIPPKKVLREDDDGKPSRPQGPPVVDLAAEAGRASDAAIKQLYSTLAQPFDEVRLKNGVPQRSEPVAREWSVAKSSPQDKLIVSRIDPPKADPAAIDVFNIESIVPYEDIVLREVETFWRNALKDPAPAEKMRAAENVLAATLFWHESARGSDRRTGPGWDAHKAKLQDKLLVVQRKEMELIVQIADVQRADSQAKELLLRIPASSENDPKLLGTLLTLRTAQLNQLIDSKKEESYSEARKLLDTLEPQFARVDPAARQGLDAIRKRLNFQGKSLLDRAQEREKAKDVEGARKLLEDAERISPDLPEVRDALLRSQNLYPIVNISVEQLPRVFWPLDTRSDADRLACDLIYESLIEPSPDEKGYSYRPTLAAGLPQIVPLGREFQIAPGAAWLTDAGTEEVNAADVKTSLKRWQDSPRGFRSNLDLLRPGQDIEPFRVPLQFSQGYVDPLGLMSFKILPPDRLGPAFKDGSHGSGPYRYHAKTSTDTMVNFTANHLYSRRLGKVGQPRIREIRFMARSPDTAKLLREKQLHMVYNPSSEEFARLQAAAEGLQGIVEFVSAPSRRIHTLAINHRGGRPLGSSTELRQALSFAIDRNELLDKVLRRGLSVHRPLTGPFPPNTWATPDQASLKFDKDVAAARAAAGLGKLGTANLTLELKHLDDPTSKAVCNEIKARIESHMPGVTITLDALPFEALYQAVEVVHNYDLAYYPFDFPSEMYWLGGLLNPNGVNAGAGNFLGYAPAQNRIWSTVLDMRNHADFARIRPLAHKVHVDWANEMPFVPLWQLDMHLVVSKRAITPPVPWSRLDPLMPFTRVEEWGGTTRP